MIDIRSSIRAIVKIQTPSFWDVDTDEIIPANIYNFDVAGKDIGEDVLSLSILKSLNSPCGKFTLNLVPRYIVGKKTWADLIPPYSLVEIRLQSYPRDPVPKLVLLGLTDDITVEESYGSVSQSRTIQVSGREASCLLVDQRIYTIPHRPQDVESGEDVRMPKIFSPGTALVGIYNINPEISGRNIPPEEAIDTFYKILTEGGVPSETNPNGDPLVNLDLPFNPSTKARLAVKDILLFDKEKASQALADPRFILPSSSVVITNDTPMWNMFTSWCCPAYQEIFVVSKEDDGRVYNEIIFRKKPFAGRLDSNGEVIESNPGSMSQLDSDLETHEISDLDVISMSLERSPQNVKNFYRVFSVSPSLNSSGNYNAYYIPLVDASINSPSSIRRYGLRIYDVNDYYISTDDLDIEIGKQREKLLWYWHRFEPVFKGGSYTIRGNPNIDIGTRLIHEGREIKNEYYVTSVSHTFTNASKNPSFMTRLKVERGWPIP